MAKVSLKNIIGKNKELNSIIRELISQMNLDAWVEDDSGKILLGDSRDIYESEFLLTLENETLGRVKGEKKGNILASLLNSLLEKESEKKKLGTEVLSLYQEINVIFNFSEKLSETIDPEMIARMALEQATHSISSDAGIIVLWDEEDRELEIPAISGDPLFSKENIITNAIHLLKIGLSGQSEIMTDLSALKEKNILAAETNSLMYAAMKVKHRIMGAIILAGRKEEQFSAANLKLLVTLALQSSSAIESAMLYEKNIREAREREEAMMKIHEVTKKFVPHEFIRSLGRKELAEVRLGDQAERIVTVLFTDIREFTTLSEKMTPEENFQFVSSFNARLGPIIRSHNGFINQYLGDSIMAIFPEEPEDALVASIKMQKAVQELNQEREKENLPPISAGIGMHTGSLIMGITGDEQRMDAATISDTVNTASRIESLTKHYKSTLLLSQETLQRIKNPERFHFRNLGHVRLKGKHKLLNIIECFDGIDPEEFDKKMITLPAFTQAMNFYYDQQFEKAIQIFQNIMAANPHDLTTRFFMDKANKYLEYGVSENWTGAEEMISK